MAAPRHGIVTRTARMTSDVELFERWSAGDEVAGEELFRRYFNAIARFFRNKATDDWPELVQKTFLKCVEARASFRGDGSFRSFLFGIAYHQLLNSYRERGNERLDFTERSAHDLDPTASACVAKREEERRLLAALRRIPVEYQVVLELHYWEEMSASACAEVLAVPLGTVKTRLRRARELLERELVVHAEGAALETSSSRIDDWAVSLRRQLRAGPDDAADHAVGNERQQR
jgi:RNA polymerase sigma factor (sigma-70 family)